MIVLGNISRKSSEKYLISLTVLLYVLRTAIPFLKFPFIFLFICLTFYFLIAYYKILFTSVLDFFRTYYLVLVLALLLLIGFLLSNKGYLLVFKDLINAFILICFALILIIAVKTKSDLYHFLKALVDQIIFWGLLIAIFRLFDLLNIFSGNEHTTLYQIPYTIEVGSLPIDYNFAILPVFLAMISLYYYLGQKISSRRKIIYNLILVITSISIIFSGSRRGAIVLSALIFINILSQFGVFNKIIPEIKNISRNTRLFLVSLLCMFISVLFVVYATPYSFKNSLLEILGTKNLVGTKGEIAHSVYRYISVFDKNTSFNSVYNTIWTPSFDPRDPDSGWGARMHKSVFPLTGKNVSIVPKNSKGYYLDHTSNADTINGMAYSPTWIFNHEFTEDMILEASVFCFVSDSCKVSTVMICSLGAMGNPGALYDLGRKGEWQLLKFTVEGKDGGANVLLYFSQNSVKNFASLGGHIIFAFPEINIIDKRDSSIIESTNWKYSRKALSGFSTRSDAGFSGLFKIRSEFPEYRNRIECSLLDLNSFKYLSYYALSDTVDKDLIRRFASQLISEDTTYLHYSADINVGEPSFNFIQGRSLRWKFAWLIYLKEYNIKEKIFGGGFNFLNWYGKYFFNDKTKSDYPHNPLLSVLLYSGLLGLTFYIFFLIKLFLIIVKYYKHFLLVSIFFIIIFFFSFFSSGSPFDPPIMGFFSILILLIDKISNSDFPTENFTSEK